MAFEYIICGAGIAGLYCALNLIEKNKVDPKTILILEKSYRLDINNRNCSIDSN